MRTLDEKIKKNKRASELRRLKLTGKTIGISGKKRYKRPGFSVMVESFDKWYTTAFCVTFKVHIHHLQKKADVVEKVEEIEGELRQLFGKWVKDQPEYYDQYICVVEIGKSMSSYIGKTKTLSVELTLKQRSTTHFKDTLEVFAPKIDGIYSSLKTLIENKGLTLKEFRGYLSDEYSDC